jgi:pimeloyl-ACP methyl ester carboxylesterase
MAHPLLNELMTEHRAFLWFGRRLGAPAAVALVIHGLNFKPAKMAAIIDVLNCADVLVLNLSLQGHGNNFVPAGAGYRQDRLKAFKSVSADLWRAETAAAYRRVNALADHLGVPIIFCGYSMGGLLGMDLLLHDSQAHFDRMLLFAPALAIRRFWRIVVGSFDLWPQLTLPNRFLRPAVAPYLANRGTPVAAYKALFEMETNFYDRLFTLGPRLNRPTLLMINPRDELLSPKRIARQIKSAELSQWQMHFIHPKGPQTTKTLHHLIIDPATVDPAVWHQATQKIRAFLATPSYAQGEY